MAHSFITPLYEGPTPITGQDKGAVFLGQPIAGQGEANEPYLHPGLPPEHSRPRESCGEVILGERPVESLEGDDASGTLFRTSGIFSLGQRYPLTDIHHALVHTSESSQT